MASLFGDKKITTLKTKRCRSTQLSIQKNRKPWSSETTTSLNVIKIQKGIRNKWNRSLVVMCAQDKRVDIMVHGYGCINKPGYGGYEYWSKGITSVHHNVQILN